MGTPTKLPNSFGSADLKSSSGSCQSPSIFRESKVTTRTKVNLLNMNAVPGVVFDEVVTVRQVWTSRSGPLHSHNLYWLQNGPKGWDEAESTEESIKWMDKFLANKRNAN